MDNMKLIAAQDAVLDAVTRLVATAGNGENVRALAEAVALLQGTVRNPSSASGK
jgi:hypothetical protein